MEEIKENEYSKGFNEGYLLAKHMPDLAEKLVGSSGSSIQLEALKKGIEEYKFEKEKKVPAWLQKDRRFVSDKDNDKSKDRDSLEKE